MQLEVIMELTLKIHLLNTFVLKKELNINFLHLEFLNKMVPLKEKNRTLVEMARTMLDEFSTPRMFWAEAISTACYVSHVVYWRPKLGKIPYELHFEHRPSVSHLRVFGCKCFVSKSGNLD
jgi:hypothetical protein